MKHRSPPRRARTLERAPTESRQASRIVAAARRHYFAHGFRSVTMDDLAGELGMSKKTLYAAFPTKNELLRAVLLEKFRCVETDLDHVLADHSADVLERLHRLLACLQSHTQEIQPPFVRDVRRETPEMFDLVQSRRRAVIERYFGAIFNAGRRAGILRKDIPTRMMIEILVGATEAIVNPRKLADLGLTPTQGYLTIITVVLEGVLTSQGRREDKTRREGDNETRRQGGTDASKDAGERHGTRQRSRVR